MCSGPGLNVVPLDGMCGGVGPDVVPLEDRQSGMEWEPKGEEVEESRPTKRQKLGEREGGEGESEGEGEGEREGEGEGDIAEQSEGREEDGEGEREEGKGEEEGGSGGGEGRDEGARAAGEAVKRKRKESSKKKLCLWEMSEEDKSVSVPHPFSLSHSQFLSSPLPPSSPPLSPPLHRRGKSNAELRRRGTPLRSSC